MHFIEVERISLETHAIPELRHRVFDQHFILPKFTEKNKDAVRNSPGLSIPSLLGDYIHQTNDYAIHFLFATNLWTVTPQPTRSETAKATKEATAIPAF